MENLLFFSNILLWIFMTIQIFAFFILARLIVSFLRRFQLIGKGVQELSLKTGQKAPLFREWDHQGRLIQLNQNGGKPTLLLFISSSCKICEEEIVPMVPYLIKNMEYRLILVARERLSSRLPDDVHFIQSDEIINNYFANQVPMFVLINEKGYIISLGNVGNFEELNLQINQSVKVAI